MTTAYYHEYGDCNQQNECSQNLPRRQGIAGIRIKRCHPRWPDGPSQIPDVRKSCIPEAYRKGGPKLRASCWLRVDGNQCICRTEENEGYLFSNQPEETLGREYVRCLNR